MATSVFITGLSGSQASAQEILGSTGVNRGYRVRALSVDGVATPANTEPFGDLGGANHQNEVAVVPGHIYEVDIDDPWVRQRLARQHGSFGVRRSWWCEVPGAASGISATATLTDATNANPVAGDTVTINNVTYRFESTMALANDVQIGATANDTLTNLELAVNGTGTAGTNYFTGTAKPTNVTADAVDTTNHSVRFVAAAGTAGNSYASTTTSAELAFGGATFSGGLASGGSDTSLLSSVPVRSLLTESSVAAAQTFISRGLPLQQQEILYPDQAGGAGGLGTSTELSIAAGSYALVDLTNPAERRALRIHPDRWCVGALDSSLVTIRGLMTTKSAPTSTGGYGLSSGRGFRIPVWENFTSTTSSNLGYVNSTANLQVDLNDANVRRALRRNVGRWVVVTAP